MTSVNYVVDSYTVAHLVHPSDRVCYVRCMQGPHFRAELHFYRDGAEIPPSHVAPGGHLSLAFAERHVAAVLATLRYEKPLAVWLNPDTGIGGLSTSSEPMGEQEGPGYRR